jgi:hypothetical protein
MLKFNPYFRCSSSEALKHSIFDNIRNKSMEKTSTKKIFLNVDSEDAFDYEKGESCKYTIEDLLKIVSNEVS